NPLFTFFAKFFYFICIRTAAYCLHNSVFALVFIYNLNTDNTTWILFLPEKTDWFRFQAHFAGIERG
ncbi:MAG: hypothetical protein LBH92_09340, partial [Bacteroidales bacterium]|nr:hypothetical protein [Bacteroidales bacterium]